ncbi:MAG: hypothetical protein JO359_03235 [Candidatus Eremiobacteraeota bacterium]|nr:hypothetical protein [Candidatus Eremiobacteraeota bacterium]
MYSFKDAEGATIASEALEILTAVTTTRRGVGRREAVTSLVFELAVSLARRDPKSVLRWVAAERERETPRDISNMVFAVAHAIAIRAARLSRDEMTAAARHFRLVQAQVEHALLYGATQAGAPPGRLQEAHGR